MTIDPVNRSGEVNPTKKPVNVSREQKVDSADSIKISTGAQATAEINKHIKIVKDSPDIRVDRVEQARKNMEAYLKDGKVDEKVLRVITERILQSDEI